MSYCHSCGIEIPDGQDNCSMCYGDPYYGKDGYYLSWLEAQELEYWLRQREEERQETEQFAEET